jgi:hypothetical protein
VKTPIETSGTALTGEYAERSVDVMHDWHNTGGYLILRYLEGAEEPPKGYDNCVEAAAEGDDYFAACERQGETIRWELADDLGIGD